MCDYITISEYEKMQTTLWFNSMIFEKPQNKAQCYRIMKNWSLEQLKIFVHNLDMLIIHESLNTQLLMTKDFSEKFSHIIVYQNFEHDMADNRLDIEDVWGDLYEPLACYYMYSNMHTHISIYLNMWLGFAKAKLLSELTRDCVYTLKDGLEQKEFDALIHFIESEEIIDANEWSEH